MDSNSCPSRVAGSTYRFDGAKTLSHSNHPERSGTSATRFRYFDTSCMTGNKPAGGTTWIPLKKTCWSTLIDFQRDLAQNPGDGPAIVDHQPWSFKSLRPCQLRITLASGGRSWRITTPGLDPPSSLLSATWDNCWINGKQLRIWHCSWRATRVCSQPAFVLFRPWMDTVQMAGTT